MGVRGDFPRANVATNGFLERVSFVDGVLRGEIIGVNAAGAGASESPSSQYGDSTGSG